MPYTYLSVSFTLSNADKMYKVTTNYESQTSDAKNFTLTLIYSWHMGSRW